jgi:hypothetical protein
MPDTPAQKKERRRTKNPKAFVRRDYRGRLTKTEAYRDAQLKHHFGITLEQYNALLVLQNGVCRICKQGERQKIYGAIKALAVDHCHLTNEIRGLLCSACNRAIGFLQDDPARADAIAKYLRGDHLHMLP